jgi:hypothetical protein
MPPKRMLRSSNPDEKVVRFLRESGIDEPLVRNTAESGYYNAKVGRSPGGYYDTVSDLMYGNKQHSSSFRFEAFVRYLKGENTFEPAPPFEATVQNMSDIEAVLADPRRQCCISEGSCSLTFRGRWRREPADWPAK